MRFRSTRWRLPLTSVEEKASWTISFRSLWAFPSSFVLKSPMKIADGEIAQFAKIYPMNARPTQPTNGRPIEASH